MFLYPLRGGCVFVWLKIDWLEIKALFFVVDINCVTYILGRLVDGVHLDSGRINLAMAEFRSLKASFPVFDGLCFNALVADDAYEAANDSHCEHKQ